MLVALLVRECAAPSGLPTMAKESDHQGSRSGGSNASVAAAAAAAAAAGALIAHACRNDSVGTPPPVPRTLGQGSSSNSTGSSAQPSSKGGFFRSLLSDQQDFSDLDSDLEDFDADLQEEEEDGGCGEPSNGTQAPRARPPSRKLWSKIQFPEGTVRASNYDMDNLIAAQAWECPCTDRRNCIGAERLGVLQLYEHRKQFQTTAARHGGLRDANRTCMEQHYDKASKSFTRSFVVGPLGDCCSASAGLAKGISFQTWANSRADVTYGRPWHAGRCACKRNNQTKEAAHLEAYIRELRSGLEGPKGGSNPKDKWSVPYMSVPDRWKEYKKKRTQLGLPVVGSESLFGKLWSQHKEIREYGAKGHPTCDECGAIQADRIKYEDRPEFLRDLDERQVRPPPLHPRHCRPHRLPRQSPHTT